MSIETSTLCNCGTLCTIEPAPFGPGWVAYCENCVDGAPDAGPLANLQGHGDTPERALWDWQEAHDEAWEVEWVPPMREHVKALVAHERKRTEGWTLTDGFLKPGAPVLWYEPGAAA